MTLHGRSVIYTLLEYFLREAKLEDRTVFITRKHNTVAQYMAMWKIIEFYLWHNGEGCEWKISGGNRRGCAYQKNGQKQKWE